MYGIIDIGSNTIRLKIYTLKDGIIKGIIDKKTFAKLANYINKDGILTNDGISILINILKEYKEILDLLEISKYYFFATASLRNAANALDIIKKVKDEVGIDITLLSGEEEARYDFYGCMLYKKEDTAIMIDIGGGSSELVFIINGEIHKEYSIPLGSLNTFNRFVKNGNIPSKKEQKKIKKELYNYLKNIEMPSADFNTIIGVGGSIRAIGKLAGGKNEFDYSLINEYVDSFSNNNTIWNKFILNLIPERFYTINTGILILKYIMRYYNISNVSISEYGIREGFLKAKLGDLNDNAK